jgi:hypothetical protein
MAISPSTSNFGRRAICPPTRCTEHTKTLGDPGFLNLGGQGEPLTRTPSRRAQLLRHTGTFPDSLGPPRPSPQVGGAQQLDSHPALGTRRRAEARSAPAAPDRVRIAPNPAWDPPIWPVAGAHRSLQCPKRGTKIHITWFSCCVLNLRKSFPNLGYRPFCLLELGRTRVSTCRPRLS